MRQEHFEAQYGPEWEAFEAWIVRREGGSRNAAARFPDGEMPLRYRRLCQHLALARDRAYGSDLTDRLNRLALRGHHALYGPRGGRRARFAQFIARDLPRLVRAEARFVWVAAALFFGPFFLLLAGVQLLPDVAYYVLPPEQLASFEEMYRPGARHLGRREADTEFGMFGFYIWNNTRIGFQVFATGLLFGLGTVFFLVSNGVVIGTTAGHLTFIGYGTTFWSFVSGHSAFELPAIVLSGAAGLKLGFALIAPGGLSRPAAVAAAARSAVRIVYAAAALFFSAAFVEAFWSPITAVPGPVKYAIGIALWVLLVGYFVFTGRDRGP